MEKYLASKLSGSAVKVLLSLVLTRHLEVEWSIAEFAIRTGLHTDMLRAALVGLSALNLIASVSYDTPKSLVSLLQEFNSVGVPVEKTGTNAEEVNDETSTVLDGLVLDSKVGRGSNGVVSEGADPVDVVTAAWLGVFPGKPLYVSAAKRWLKQYDAAFIVGVIEKVGEYNANQPVRSPYTYVEGALKREFEKASKPDNDGVDITPDMWKLVDIGRTQYVEKRAHQNRSRHQ